jgi:group I intron endonuclease
VNEIENIACAAIGKTSSRNEQAVSDVTTPEKIVGIYGLRNKITGKWYVGQSIDIYDRWESYRILKCKLQRKLYAALKKYGFDAFDKIILEKCIAQKSILDNLEDHYIVLYDSITNGYNLKRGGSAGTLSSESKSRISKSLIGRFRGSESPFYGKHHSQEVRDKISKNRRGKGMGERNTNYGKPLSEDVRQKIGKARFGKCVGNLNPMFGVRRVGEDNPNFGNTFTHTSDAKEKIRQASIMMWKRRKEANGVIGT